MGKETRGQKAEGKPWIIWVYLSRDDEKGGRAQNTRPTLTIDFEVLHSKGLTWLKLQQPKRIFLTGDRYPPGDGYLLPSSGTDC